MWSEKTPFWEIGPCTFNKFSPQKEGIFSLSISIIQTAGLDYQSSTTHIVVPLFPSQIPSNIYGSVMLSPQHLNILNIIFVVHSTRLVWIEFFRYDIQYPQFVSLDCQSHQLRQSGTCRHGDVLLKHHLHHQCPTLVLTTLNLRWQDGQAIIFAHAQASYYIFYEGFQKVKGQNYIFPGLWTCLDMVNLQITVKSKQARPKTFLPFLFFFFKQVGLGKKWWNCVSDLAKVKYVTQIHVCTILHYS